MTQFTDELNIHDSKNNLIITPAANFDSQNTKILLKVPVTENTNAYPEALNKYINA